MAFGKKSTTVAEPPPPSLIASAARVTVASASYPLYRYTDEAWQREAWLFYESNGELSYTADYIGAAQSLVRYYIRHVDENGVPQGEVDDDPVIAKISAQMLGGPIQATQVRGALGIALTVAGDCYLIARAATADMPDTWTVVASHFVRFPGAGKVQVDFGNGKFVTLDPSRNVVMRVWRQSAQRPLLARASTRALLGDFDLLQKLRLFMRSELNSRIASGPGVQWIPSELTFPGDADNNIPPGAPGVAQMMYESWASNLEGNGTAAAVGPIVAEGPIEIIERIPDPKPFVIPLSERSMDYRRELIQTIARGMNVPSDVVEGMRNANHWQSWWATEEFTTKTVAPDSALICDALNTGWLIGALKANGKDPKRYTVWYDLAPLHNSADKFTDTLNLYREGAVSLETLLKSANYTLADAPEKKEYLQRKLWAIVERDPSLLQSEGVRDFLELEVEGFVPELATPPPPPPTPDTVPADRQVGTKPGAQNIELVDDLRAALVQESPVVPVAHSVVLAALAITGRRLRTSRNEFRGMYKDHDPTLMHTKIKVRDTEHAETLLADAALATARSSFEGLSVDPDVMVGHIHQYTRGLLETGIPHSRELLSAFLNSAGVR